MKVIDDNALRDTALRALKGNMPLRLSSFSLDFEPRTGGLSCLAVFSDDPTESEIDDISSAISEIEAAWPEIQSTTDKYLSSNEAGALPNLRISIDLNMVGK